MQLTSEQFNRLKGVAKERGVSMSEVMREAVDRHLSIGVTESERRERAISSIGGFHSKLKDVSEKHDDYLEDAYDR